jgi:hypothetical protein
MPMQKTPTSQDFANCKDELFKAFAPESTDHVELRLTDVNTISSELANAQQKVSYSLLFEGPQSPFLAQGLYQLDNQSLGSMEIFLVPIGQKSSGAYCYQAVFN